MRVAVLLAYLQIPHSITARQTGDIYHLYDIRLLGLHGFFLTPRWWWVGVRLLAPVDLICRWIPAHVGGVRRRGRRRGERVEEVVTGPSVWALLTVCDER